MKKVQSFQNLLKSSHSSSSLLLDVRDYEFNFECLFDVEKCRELFKQYLTSIQNSEPLSFLESVEEFQMKRSTKNRYEQAKTIIQTYLEVGSTNEINVSSGTRQSLLEKFQTLDEDHCPNDLFTDIYMTVFLELKHDTFSNFTSSVMFRSWVTDMVKQQGDSFLKKVATVKKSMSQPNSPASPPLSYSNQFLTVPNTPNSPSSVASLSDRNCSTEDDEMTDIDVDTTTTTTQLSYQTMFDMSPFFYDDHFEAMRKEMSEPVVHWKKINNSADRSIYIAKKSHKVVIHGKSRKVRKYKESGILNFSAQEVFYAYIDKRYVLYPEPLFKSIDFIQFHSKDNTTTTSSSSIRYASTIMHMKYQVPFPMKHRDYILSCTARKEHDGSYVILRKSTDCSLIDKQVGHMRSYVASMIVFEPVDNNSTRYTICALVEQGWAPARTWSAMVKERETSFHIGLNKACTEQKSRRADNAAVKPPKESNYMYNVFAQN
jgi:hypothetical protein